MSEAVQALCYVAGAKFRLLRRQAADHAQPRGQMPIWPLLARLGLRKASHSRATDWQGYAGALVPMLAVLVALAVDRILGEPPARLHLVVWMGHGPGAHGGLAAGRTLQTP